MRTIRTSLAFLLLSALLITGCVSAPQNQSGGNTQMKGTGPVRIGFLMDTLKEERWQRDKDLFEAYAKKQGAEVTTLVANGSDAEQQKQAENLLTKGVDVLVVVPHNAEAAASIVEAGKKAGKPVISYDRLIKDSDVDLYIAHQVVKIGQMQAQYLVNKQPKGNYVLIGGAPTDNNAVLLRQGQMEILKPYVDRGDIKIVADPYAKEWQPNEAMKHMENALTQSSNNVQAVVASNDGTAGGVVQALEAQGLAGKVLVSGQDADLAALQRIVEGKQAMTIYKPIKPLAESAVDAAIKLARGEKVATTTTINNGRKDVPAILHEPMAIGKDDVMNTVVKDGYLKMEDIYRNVPKDQWPKPTESATATGTSGNTNTSTSP
ncbi:MAG: D-xylose ABC transporter substrate-binding protein, partial [Acidobacteria bacterium]|nr:D-xylose ABC transporter substrate-binding protein [Acidobacteriota bacterium]